MGAFFRGTFEGKKEKRAFKFTPPKQMPFSDVFSENIFEKAQGTQLHAIVAPNKCLEWALLYPSPETHQ